MTTKAGVWIDHKQAVVVLVTGAEKEIKKIAFDIGQPIRAAGGSRSTKPYKPKEFVVVKAFPRMLSPGNRLVREFKGRHHVKTVTGGAPTTVALLVQNRALVLIRTREVGVRGNPVLGQHRRQERE